MSWWVLVTCLKLVHLQIQQLQAELFSRILQCCIFLMLYHAISSIFYLNFCFSSWFTAKESTSVNNTVKYLIVWHFKNQFLCILCINMFSEGFLWFTFIIFCLANAFWGNSSIPAGLYLKGCHYLEWII